jgi:SsrA-binding protein
MAIAENRKARYDYAIGETFEAGVVLTGSEVKALRQGRANIAEAYVSVEGDGVWLVNASIEIVPGTAQGRLAAPHEPRRPRRLLVHKREAARIAEAVQRSGMTAVALSLYWGGRGLAKVAVALAKGKRQYDKRQAVREREWGREKARLLKNG